MQLGTRCDKPQNKRSNADICACSCTSLLSQKQTITLIRMLAIGYARARTPMVVGRPEGVLCHSPAGREHNKVHHSHTYRPYQTARDPNFDCCNQLQNYTRLAAPLTDAMVQQRNNTPKSLHFPSNQKGSRIRSRSGNGCSMHFEMADLQWKCNIHLLALTLDW